MGFELSHGTLEKLDQLPLRTLQLAAKLLESGRRIVSNLRVFVNRALDRILDPLVDEKRSDLAGEDRRHHRRGALAAQGFARDARAPQQGAHDEELRSGE